MLTIYEQKKYKNRYTIIHIKLNKVSIWQKVMSCSTWSIKWYGMQVDCHMFSHWGGVHITFWASVRTLEKTIPTDTAAKPQETTGQTSYLLDHVCSTSCSYTLCVRGRLHFCVYTNGNSANLVQKRICLAYRFPQLSRSIRQDTFLNSLMARPGKKALMTCYIFQFLSLCVSAVMPFFVFFSESLF